MEDGTINTGPKGCKVGDVIEADGSLWIVDQVRDSEVVGVRLANGSVKRLSQRTFRARQVAGIWRRIGKHQGRA